MADTKRRTYGRRFAYLYLIAGGVLVLVAVFAQPGIYRGSLNGQFSIEYANTMSFISLRAETEPAWHWFYPRNHSYQQVTMACIGDGQKKVDLNLTEGTWTCEGNRGTLDADSLAHIITFGHDADAIDSGLLQQTQSLLVSLQQMHAGSFLPERHHPYYIEKPFRASYQHFTLGQNWGLFAIFAWLLVWPAYLVLFKQPAWSKWLTPRRAFLITGCVIVALDLVFAGIAAVFSPGSISEAMELLTGLLNMPAWVVLGDRAVATPLGWAFGAVSWSVLISIGVSLTKTPAQHRADASDVPTNDQSRLPK